MTCHRVYLLKSTKNCYNVLCLCITIQSILEGGLLNIDLIRMHIKGMHLFSNSLFKLNTHSDNDPSLLNLAVDFIHYMNNVDCHIPDQHILQSVFLLID